MAIEIPASVIDNAIREINPSRCTISITWADAPHLNEESKEDMRRATPSHMQSAREYGIPAIGSGLVFQVNPRDIKCKPFEIPPYWPRLYGLDVGIRKTAALWMAWDREADIVYFYSEHYQGNVVPAVHAAAIKTRGTWIPGVVDPSSRNRSATDGQRLFTQYTQLGLNLVPAKNAVESGIFRVQEMLSEGRLRVFNTLSHFFDELRFYRRDEHGRIFKPQADHLLDSMRYLIHEYETHAIVRPTPTTNRHKYRPGVASVGY